MAAKKLSNTTDAEEVAAVYRPPSALVPWPKNPRINDAAVADVAASIQRFGFGEPILARLADARIIAGHTRHKAALVLGLERVPVRYMDLTEDEADALTLADNKLGEKARWDETLLREHIARLAGTTVDVSGLGFDAGELAALLATAPIELPSESAEQGKPSAGAHEGPPSHVRLVQLFLNETTHPIFQEQIKVAAARYGTTTVTDTVVRVLQEDHARASGGATPDPGK